MAKMSGWSAENATNAYLGAMKMSKGAKEPDASSFIAAMVAGMNARLTVIVCVDTAEATVLALAVAARETGGKVVCFTEANQSSKAAAAAPAEVEQIAGNAENLISSVYADADCIVMNWAIKNSQRILKTAKTCAGNALLLGYNACRCVRGFDSDPLWLPIGGGLLVDRAPGRATRPHWVVRVDKFTGEEHIFRLRRKHTNTNE